jgi:hypothetical protein
VGKLMRGPVTPTGKRLRERGGLSSFFNGPSLAESKPLTEADLLANLEQSYRLVRFGEEYHRAIQDTLTNMRVREGRNV